MLILLLQWSLDLDNEVKLLLQLSKIFTIVGEWLTDTEVFYGTKIVQYNH